MPSKSFESRQRRKRIRHNRLKLERINQRRLKLGMDRAHTLTQAWREWKAFRARETNTVV